MKSLSFCLALTAIAALSSCTKEMYKPTTVVRDCTGTYLRSAGKDYHVCNPGIVSKYPNDAVINARFKNINGCSDLSNTLVCKMLHMNEGWIEVQKIK